MVKLTDIKGIGPATIKILQERKIKTVEALASLSLEELRKIPGFKGELRARAVKQAAADSLRDKLIKPIKPAGTADSSPQTVIKKTVTDQTVSLPKADKEKDKDKKKARKDDKKADKDKDKKKKNKDKKKNAKKKDKKKS
ncbi:MAG: helix-hairpin-helix domain-containing protein [Nitrosomonas sp.]|uniref:helix-hairpin-helix domain-containing protein n=1 Tax=Nitrosomonas sp. TaxID=42353 RepID=UPI0025D7BC1C|nr:helix-hairpin-helix domain-containing protein [Nitrosomonas sp.]UJP03809.1 MAG: helix-hairpin-helix domain-containing protein [Nitrosomonas sp.]